MYLCMYVCIYTHTHTCICMYTCEWVRERRITWKEGKRKGKHARLHLLLQRDRDFRKKVCVSLY